MISKKIRRLKLSERRGILRILTSAMDPCREAAEGVVGQFSQGLRHVLEIMTLALSVGIDQIAPFHDSPKTALIEVRKIFNG